MSTRYIWFDTEYSTLELEQAVLLQIAMVMTDERLRRVQPDDPGLNLFLRLEEGNPPPSPPGRGEDKMSPPPEGCPDALRGRGGVGDRAHRVIISSWVEKNIPEIVAACRSDRAITLEEAQKRIVEYIDALAGKASSEIKKRPMLAGNSLQCDWFLARKFLPGLIDRIHYRLLDVSSIKLQWLNWRGEPEFDKENLDLLKQWMPPDAPDITGKKHDAWYDIHASMAELNFYRAHFLRGKGE